MSLAPSRRTFLQQASGALLAFAGGPLPLGAQGPTTQAFYDPATLGHEPAGDHPENTESLLCGSG